MDLKEVLYSVFDSARLQLINLAECQVEELNLPGFHDFRYWFLKSEMQKHLTSSFLSPCLYSGSVKNNHGGHRVTYYFYLY